MSKATYSERHNQVTMRSRPKYYLTVLNYLIQVLLAANAALRRGSEEGHEQEKRVEVSRGEEGKVEERSSGDRAEEDAPPLGNIFAR